MWLNPPHEKQLANFILFKNKFTFLLIYQLGTVTGGTKHAGHELNYPICNDLYIKRKAEWFSQELECTCSSHFKVTSSSLKRKSIKSRSKAHFHIALGFAARGGAQCSACGSDQDPLEQCESNVQSQIVLCSHFLLCIPEI